MLIKICTKASFRLLFVFIIFVSVSSSASALCVHSARIINGRSASVVASDSVAFPSLFSYD